MTAGTVDVAVPERVAEPAKSPRRRSFVRLHPAWLVVAAGCAYFLHVSVQSGLDTDVFWHLKAGNWMLAHHAVISHDLWSYTIPGHTWVAEEWGFEVLLAWAVTRIGPVMYWVIAVGPCCAALVMGVWRWRRMGAQPLWAATLAVLAAFPLELGVADRPQVFSYLFFSLELLLLTMARRNRRWLLALPALILLWANIHGSFLLGLGLMVLECVFATGPARRLLRAGPDGGRGRIRLSRPLPFRAALAALVASGVAACVNPQGPYLYSYAYKVSSSSKLGAYIKEWRSPDFHSPGIMIGIGVFTVIAIAVLVAGRRPVELLDLVLWLGALLAALHAVRFTPYLGLALGGVLAPYQPIRRETIRPNLVTPAAIVLMLLAVLSLNHPAAGTPARFNPVRAAAWLQQQPGRVFSSYVYNDYLIRVGIPVFVDGRTDMYFGTGILGTYIKVESLSEPPDPVLNRWNVEWVLWPKNQPLSIYLSRDPAWRLARTFGTDQVFERA